MENNTNSDKQTRLRQWLDDLQSRSWQLELLISGLSIALLLQLRAPLIRLVDRILIYSSDQLVIEGFMNVVGLLAGHAWLFVTVNLIILVILRGMWVGTIGLRTLSDRIDFEALGFADPFVQMLKRKVVDYDRYVEKMDELLSIIFAFTFVAILIILSVCLSVLALFAGMQLMIWLTEWTGIAILETIFKRGWQGIFLLGAAVYAIDFVTLGWVKKKKRWFRWYYPVYRFFGWITLSGLYRPLYYNLISSRIGRRAAFLIIPYIILLNVIDSINLLDMPYFHYSSSPVNIVSSFYDDERHQVGTAGTVSIPSKIVSGSFLEVFIRYEPKEDDIVLEQICPGVNRSEEHPAFSKMQCMQQLPQIIINDSIYQDLSYKFYVHPVTNDKGLLSLIDVAELGRGEHLLKVSKQMHFGAVGLDTIALVEKAVIPFWKD